MKIPAAVALALMLTACKTPSLIPPSETVIVAQAGTSVDAAYNVAAQAYLAALPTMPAATKATVKPLLVKAYGFVQAADAAEKLGDATTVAAQAGNAMALIAQIKSALGVS
jgi:hypothetical protein